MIPDPKPPKAGLFSPRAAVPKQSKILLHTNTQQTIKKTCQTLPQVL
jgi:hypothetical protein